MINIRKPYEGAQNGTSCGTNDLPIKLGLWARAEKMAGFQILHQVSGLQGALPVTVKYTFSSQRRTGAL